MLRLPPSLAAKVQKRLRRGDDVSAEMWLEWREGTNGRLGAFGFGGHEYGAALWDLPNVVEGHKTRDGALYMKTADVAQLIVVYESEAEVPPAGFDHRWPHGLTPPAYGARKAAKPSPLDDDEKGRCVPLVEAQLLRMMRHGAVGEETASVREVDAAELRRLRARCGVSVTSAPSSGGGGGGSVASEKPRLKKLKLRRGPSASPSSSPNSSPASVASSSSLAPAAGASLGGGWGGASPQSAASSAGFSGDSAGGGGSSSDESEGEGGEWSDTDDEGAQPGQVAALQARQMALESRRGDLQARIQAAQAELGRTNNPVTQKRKQADLEQLKGELQTATEQLLEAMTELAGIV